MPHPILEMPVAEVILMTEGVEAASLGCFLRFFARNILAYILLYIMKQGNKFWTAMAIAMSILMPHLLILPNVIVLNVSSGHLGVKKTRLRDSWDTHFSAENLAHSVSHVKLRPLGHGGAKT